MHVADEDLRQLIADATGEHLLLRWVLVHSGAPILRPHLIRAIIAILPQGGARTGEYRRLG